MADRNTRITGKQILDGSITVDELSIGVNTSLDKAHDQNTDTILLGAAGEIKDIEQPAFEWSEREYLNAAGPQSKIAQIFQAVHSGTLTKVSIAPYTSYDTGVMTVSIRTIDENEKPTETILATVNANIIDLPHDSDGAYYDLSFLSPATLVSGTKYAIVITSNSTNDLIINISAAGVYTNGKYWVYNLSLEEWQTSYPDSDLKFRVYVTVSAAPLLDTGILKSDLAVDDGILVDGYDISELGESLVKLETDVEYYVGTTGSDETGTGAVGAPFATINHALSLIPKNLNRHTAAIYLQNGIYIECVGIYAFYNGVIYIASVSNDKTLVTIQSPTDGVSDVVDIAGSSITDSSGLGLTVCFQQVGIKLTNDSLDCIWGNYFGALQLYFVAFGIAEGLSGITIGVDVSYATVYALEIAAIDSNKVAYQYRLSYNMITCDTFGTWGGGVTTTDNRAGVLINDAGKLYGQSSVVANEVPTGDIDGENAAFTLASIPVLNTVKIYLNGLLQQPGEGKDYTVSGQTVTFVIAPQVGDIILAEYDV